ncbi:hypothetical protein LCGC14_0360140 [marine sediment metagenome]|uniref:Uncharacterized protein n=1 Tax=marine sediment metagenome TaxID=412755 RepID=A0A0F9T8C2_9ZZZZ
MAITPPKSGKSTKPPASKTTKRPPPPPTTKQTAKAAVPTKKFKVESWETGKEGKRILLYGDTGIGKSSLALLAPKPVFLGLDEGGGQLRHPVTGEKPKRIPSIEDFTDVRTVLQDTSLFDPHETAVIDTVTILQDWAEPHVIQTIPTEKDAMVKNLIGYGYNKGYKHLYNVMKEPLQDCDELIRRGKNVILIAQAGLFNVPNPGGEDYLRAGPRLHADKSWSIEALYCEWADYILRIDYYNTFVKGKRVSGSTDRAVFVQPELHFRAKTRTPWYDDDGRLVSAVSFETLADDSIWKFIFGGE